MSNTRPSIVVEPLATNENGEPVLPTKAKSPGSETPPDLTSITIPDTADVDAKFKGKSLADVIQMVQNGDKKIGEMGNELGTWRKLVADLGATQGPSQSQVPSQPEPDEPPLELTADDLLNDPTGTLTKALERSPLAKSIQAIEQKLSLNEQAQAVQQLVNDFPEMAELNSDEAFQQWAVSSPGRAADAQAAQQGDAAAARRLLETWRERNELVTALQQQQEGSAPKKAAAPAQSDKPQGLEGAAQAVTERGGQGGAPSGQHLSSQEIMDMIINRPEVYRSPEYQAKVAEAAKAGALKIGAPNPEARYVR
jgi:hypothetical protein